MPRSRMHRRTRMLPISMAALVLSGTRIMGQSPVPDKPPAPAVSSETSPQDGKTETAGDPSPGRPALLREGTLLVDVKGWMRFDEATRSWRYVTDSDDASVPGYELTLLPNSILEEMIELRQVARGHAVAFEVSGQVFVYRGASYFLASHAPQLVEHETIRDSAGGESAGVSGDTSGEASAPADDDSVESLRRELLQSVGPIARASSVPDRDRAESSELLAEGLMLVSRRGRLARTPGGSWKFVFDADASGMSDPPLTIIPCLQLERMEQYAHRQRGMAPIIISGQVLQFYGHNFLIPTVFQVPRERTRLTP